MLRTSVTFEADFPDALDMDGEILLPMGLAIARFLRETLCQASIDTSEPGNCDDYAWDLYCKIGRVKIWILIGAAEPWLVAVRSNALLPRFLRPRGEPEALREASQVIGRALKRDLRFRTIRWLTEKEFDSLDDTLGAEAP